MQIHGRSLACWLLVCLFSGSPAATAVAAQPTDVDFRRDIRPILSDNCFQCHGPDTERESELRLDQEQSAKQMRDGVAAVVPYQVEQSLLYQRVTTNDHGLRMPPVDSGKSLTPREIELLRIWIEQGAPWAGHWAFEEIVLSSIPRVDGNWPRNSIDAFVQQRLSAAGLSPSTGVDRRTFIRRLSFDLTGLPPSPDEVEEFVHDTLPQALERLVDRYLGSPAFGERWGRVWLDLARYTDTTAEWLNSTGQAWLYRDWVIRAVNEDMPYDRFVRMQLAADSMPNIAVEDLPALGFLGLSPTYWKELRLAPDVIKQVVADEWDERIDAVSRTFLGLTVSCARCHDHKFDPISSQDYYALAGVFASSQLGDRPLLPKDEAERVLQAREHVFKLEEQLSKLNKDDNDGRQQLEQQIADIRKSTPHFDALSAHVMVDSSIYVEPDGPDLTKLEYRPGEARDLPMFVRGNPSNTGQVVERQFLAVLSKDEPRKLNNGSGRGDLVEALFTEARSLTARVIVNRIWEQHFGLGLVRTPSDFGSQGDPPSHPELLDYLAGELIRHGWSLKWLHREIVLSATYQQSSLSRPEGRAIDPENRLLWRMNRRRVEVEMLRDAMLTVTGQLDRHQGGPALDLDDLAHQRRTVYGQIGRHELNRVLRLFDFPESTSHSPRRIHTTTPLQQLFLLNAPFVQQQADLFASQLADEPDGLTNIEMCYARLFGRPPDETEVQVGLEFLSSATEVNRQSVLSDYVHALFGLNEFLYID